MTLPQGHLLRRLSGNIYSHASKLNHLFDMMKREHLASAQIAEAVDMYIASLPERPAYIYQRNGKGYKKGDVKQKQLDEETNRMLLTKAGALLFETYEQKLKERGHYDYNDMILWVLDAFDTLPWLQADL
jgi:DNA helicase II / ATP-dependent DNA helicase PcrA